MTGIKIRTEARFDIRSLSLVFYLIFFLFFYQLLLSASCFLSVSCSLSDLIADALEVVYAGLDVAQGSLLVPGVALLLDGDVAAVADLLEGSLDGGIIQGACADGAHGSFAAAVEETDVLAHDLLVNLLVDILEVDIIQNVSVFLT